MSLDERITVLDLYLGLEELLDDYKNYEVETFNRITVNVEGSKKFRRTLYIDNENKKVFLESEHFGNFDYKIGKD